MFALLSYANVPPNLIPGISGSLLFCHPEPVSGSPCFCHRERNEVKRDYLILCFITFLLLPFLFLSLHTPFLA
jgi:hypothetical protein